MRALLVEYSGSARDKAERIKGLERGTIAPSPALTLLLTEFNRTRSDSPVQYARNIKSFLADYLNPPVPDQRRFSLHNLFELREKLSPAERDYFFKVVDGTKQAVISGEKIKQLELGQVPRTGFGGRAGAGENSSASRTNRAGLSELREQLEERVASYLISVVQTRGVQSLESDREGLQHGRTVNRIIKDTFTEKGYELEHFRLNTERLTDITGKLISELPQELRGQRNRNYIRSHSLAAVAPDNHAQIVGNMRHAFQNVYERDVRERVAREVVRPVLTSVTERSLDDEVVEQKVGRIPGQAQEPEVHGHTPPHVITESQRLIQQPRAQELAAKAKDQHIRQHIRTR
jgi:hypothetical protein